MRTDHVELNDICEHLEAIIAGSMPPSSVDLFGVRMRLASKLIAHLKAEDWLVYPRLLASNNPEIAATARRFVDEMGGLAATFSAYVDAWDALRIEREWDQYKAATADILASLRSRIMRENRELYPLVERLERAA